MEKSHFFTLHIHTLTAIISIFFYMVELQGAEKPIFRNYRHFVSQCPVNTLHWLPNFSLTRHGLTQTKVHSLAKWIALSGKRTVIACVAIEVHDHYTTAPLIIFMCQIFLQKSLTDYEFDLISWQPDLLCKNSLCLYSFFLHVDRTNELKTNIFTSACLFLVLFLVLPVVVVALSTYRY